MSIDEKKAHDKKMRGANAKSRAKKKANKKKLGGASPSTDQKPLMPSAKKPTVDVDDARAVATKKTPTQKKVTCDEHKRKAENARKRVKAMSIDEKKAHDTKMRAANAKSRAKKKQVCHCVCPLPPPPHPLLPPPYGPIVTPPPPSIARSLSISTLPPPSQKIADQKTADNAPTNLQGD
jgi:hypothetical protein